MKKFAERVSAFRCTQPNFLEQRLDIIRNRPVNLSPICAVVCTVTLCRCRRDPVPPEKCVNIALCGLPVSILDIVERRIEFAGSQVLRLEFGRFFCFFDGPMKF